MSIHDIPGVCMACLGSPGNRIEPCGFCCDEPPCKNEDHGCKTTCCCGEDMETHSNPMNCGHTPVSMHWWYCEGNCEREYGRGDQEGA